MCRYLLFLALGIPQIQATYSIAACDQNTRQCGVAVQTNNLAVGASVPYAQAGVGAIASQFETNPTFGPRGLALLAEGKSPEQTVKQLLAEDGNFGGDGPEARQLGLVSIDGRAAVHTGEQAAGSPWAGSRTGKGYSVQGNGLAGSQVVDSMETAYLSATGTLAERLLAALTAGDRAGGQTTGRESAALLVRTPAGFPFDIDLRVDHAADPVGDLRTLFNIQSARQQVIQARIAAAKGNVSAAKSLLMGAVSRAPMWPRIWIAAARVADSIEEPDLALQYLNIAFTMNPAWAAVEIGRGNYAGLGANPIFHQWVTAAQENAARSDFAQIATRKNKQTEVAKRLLEIGMPTEALAVLQDQAASTEILLLRASAYAASGKYAEAIKQCRIGLNADPQSVRLRLRAAKLKAQLN